MPEQHDGAAPQQAAVQAPQTDEKQKKRKFPFWVFLIGIALLLIAAALLLWYCSRDSDIPTVKKVREKIQYSDTEAPRGSAEKITRREYWTVCIDAGHGYCDPGAQSTYLNGLDEADVNLAVACRLRDILKQRNIRVVMTREEGSGYDPDAKKLELADRTDLANSSEIDLFVSIHCNSFTDPAVSGTRLYYTLDGTWDNATKMLACKLGDAFSALSPVSPALYPQPVSDSFYVVRNTDVPAVLIELGFITNPEEGASMATQSWQKEAAQSLYEGIAQYIEDEKY